MAATSFRSNPSALNIGKLIASLRQGTLLIALLFLAGCGGGQPSPLFGQSACTPSFPYINGWLGGDAAYSIPTGPHKSLWFFGDSFIGQKGATNRHDAAFIANSVAVSECQDGVWNISYFWRESSGAIEPIFRSGTKAYKYWPLSSFWHDTRLYLFLERIEQREKSGSLQFRIVGVDLAHIENPSAPPNVWRVSTTPLYGRTDLIPGVANSIQGEHLYIITTLEGARYKTSGDHHAAILARLPLSELETPTTLETFGRNGLWHSGLQGRRAKRIMPSAATEMSLRYHRPTESWVAVMPAAKPFAPYGVIKTAPAVEGPWTEGRKFITYKEQLAAIRQKDPSVFCYAAKEHGQFARPPDTLIVTYVCNTLDESVLDRMDLYRPVAQAVSPSRKRAGKKWIPSRLARFFNTLF